MRRHTGVNGVPAVIAAPGIVYDVSQSLLWQHGRHQALHGAGDDLTGSLDAAPHGPDVLARFPVVGTLADA